MSWLNYCRDCDRIIMARAQRAQLPKHQRVLYLPGIDGRCVTCYQKHLREFHRSRPASKPAPVVKKPETRFCPLDGCWLLIGENCPACEYELLVKGKAA